jgi:hypothetical protein
MMDWAVESEQLMVMLLLDFKKACDAVEWGFLEGAMMGLSFDSQWIAWNRILHADSWCIVGMNRIKSEAFKLSRLVRKGCLLAPFLYLFIADCLRYLLENMENIKRIVLQGGKDTLIDCKFKDNTNLYLEGTSENLMNVKTVLDIFVKVAGASINSHKSNAIWALDNQKTWIWGNKVNLRWLENGETTRCLGF